MSFLEIENIGLTYQTPTGQTEAVKDVSFSVEKGEFVSIVGPSGCGKSTILSCIAGLNKVSRGNIQLMGRRIDGIDNRTGYMFQSDNLLPWRTIYKNVMLGAEIQGKKECGQYAEELLKKYGLWEFRDAYPSNLSGGMRQRTALIRTLAVRPQLLLLDEAFSALDYQSRINVSADVYNILKNEGKTIIMVTHDIREAVSMSDKVVVLTHRPAQVAKVVRTEFKGERNPIEVRSRPDFRLYYNTIWEEMKK